MKLRPYQHLCLDSIRTHYESGCSRQLAVLATGLGKAVIAANVPNSINLPRNKRVLFLVHRDELAFQAAEKMERCNPGRTVGMEKAQYRAGDSDIVIASVQTIGRGITNEGSDGAEAWSAGPRLAQFNPDHFGLVMPDEAHHINPKSKQWLGVLRYFGVLKGDDREDKRRLLVGWTATPNRSDHMGLECSFEEIVFNYGIRPGCNDGWLARPVAHRLQTEVDISKVATTAGDFQVNELENAVNTPQRNELIVREYGKLKPNGPSIFYTVDIQHSIDLAAALRAKGHKIYPLSGRTPEDERAKFMRLMRDGAIDGLCSCGVLNEGTDIPRVAAGWMCRPTKSSLLFQQQVGRILRLYPSPEEREELMRSGRSPDWTKDEAIIIDVVDLSGRHSLVTIATLFGLRQKFDSKGKDIIEQVEAIEEAERDHPNVDLRDIPDISHLKTTLQRIDLLAAPNTPPEIARLSDFKWLQQAEGRYHLGLSDGKILSVSVNTLGSHEVWQSVRGIRTMMHVARSLREAIQVAERYIPSSDRRWMGADCKWREKEPKESQVRLLWTLDRNIKHQFPKPDDLYRFALGRFKGGDLSYSRGAVSDRISQVKAARA